MRAAAMVVTISGREVTTATRAAPMNPVDTPSASAIWAELRTNQGMTNNRIAVAAAKPRLAWSRLGRASSCSGLRAVSAWVTGLSLSSRTPPM